MKKYFIFIIADGIFDSIKNKDIILLIWETLFELKKSEKEKNEIISIICNRIINISIEKGSYDNLSCIFIGFDNFFNNNEPLNNIIEKIKRQSCEKMIVK